jgi:hypothetical protein
MILQHMLVLDTRHRWAVLRHAANDAKKVAPCPARWCTTVQRDRSFRSYSPEKY